MANSLTDLMRREMVWQKGHPVPGLNPAEWRQDDFGRRIRWSDYGNHQSPFGWSIDHIFPSAFGGPDSLDNLRPLHCGTNSSLGGIVGALMR